MLVNDNSNELIKPKTCTSRWKAFGNIPQCNLFRKCKGAVVSTNVGSLKIWTLNRSPNIKSYKEYPVIVFKEVSPFGIPSSLRCRGLNIICSNYFCRWKIVHICSVADLKRVLRVRLKLFCYCTVYSRFEAGFSFFYFVVVAGCVVLVKENSNISRKWNMEHDWSNHQHEKIGANYSTNQMEMKNNQHLVTCVFPRLRLLASVHFAFSLVYCVF